MATALTNMPIKPARNRDRLPAFSTRKTCRNTCRSSVSSTTTLRTRSISNNQPVSTATFLLFCSFVLLALVVQIYVLVSKCQKLCWQLLGSLTEQSPCQGQGKGTHTQSPCISKLSGLPTAPTHELLTVDFLSRSPFSFFLPGTKNLLGLH